MMRAGHSRIGLPCVNHFWAVLPTRPAEHRVTIMELHDRWTPVFRAWRALRFGVRFAASEYLRKDPSLDGSP